MLKAIIAAVAMAALPCVALAEETLTKVVYTCPAGEPIQAVFLNTDAGDSYAVIMEKGELIPMAREKSASGAVYKSSIPDQDFELLTKGQNADLVATTGDKEEWLKSDCVSKD